MQPISQPHPSVCANNQNQKDFENANIDNDIVDKANECFIDLQKENSELILTMDKKFEVIENNLEFLEEKLTNDPVFVCKNIKTFPLLNEKARAEVFIKAFNKDKYSDIKTEILNTFSDFELKDPEIIFYIL